MKADHMGQWAEQCRARMGWKSPAQRKADGVKDSTVCCNCKYYWAKEIPNRDGGCPNYSPYCGHPGAAGERGHATRDTASCNKWELKP